MIDAANNVPMVNGQPMMLVRMRCPACAFDYRFLVQVDLPLMDLPEVTKKTMRCKCRNKIPKIDRNTPIESTLMSINAVPFKDLKERQLFNAVMGGRPTFQLPLHKNPSMN